VLLLVLVALAAGCATVHPAGHAGQRTPPDLAQPRPACGRYQLGPVNGPATGYVLGIDRSFFWRRGM
jgi:hypothetical protein